MKMKKLATLLLAVLMLLATLAGCAGKKPDIGGSITPPESNVPDNPLSVGRLEGGTYTNKYIGIACTLNSNWKYFSAEELQEMPDQVGDLMDGSELGEALKGRTQIFDMQAENTTDLTSMNILYQKLSMAERISYAAMTESQIIDQVLGQRDAMEESYAQAGITVVSMEKKAVTFLGEERYAVYTVAKTQGIDYYILQLFSYDLGEYSATITMGSFVQDKTADLLKLFRAA